MIYEAKFTRFGDIKRIEGDAKRMLRLINLNREMNQYSEEQVEIEVFEVTRKPVTEQDLLNISDN